MAAGRLRRPRATVRSLPRRGPGRAIGSTSLPTGPNVSESIGIPVALLNSYFRVLLPKGTRRKALVAAAYPKRRLSPLPTGIRNGAVAAAGFGAVADP